MSNIWQGFFAPPIMNFNFACERVHMSGKIVRKFLGEISVSRPGKSNTIAVKKTIF
jgi:hypothetical protein